jgi:hypothetical protein
MSMALEPVFSCFHRCVTTLSAQRDAAVQQTLVTCGHATHITIYSCRTKHGLG